MAVLQLQGQHGKVDKRCSYPEVFRQIYAQRGLPGLYAGIIPEYAKVAIAFCSYEVCLSATYGMQMRQSHGREGVLIAFC